MELALAYHLAEAPAALAAGSPVGRLAWQARLRASMLRVAAPHPEQALALCPPAQATEETSVARRRRDPARRSLAADREGAAARLPTRRRDRRACEIMQVAVVPREGIAAAAAVEEEERDRRERQEAQTGTTRTADRTLLFVHHHAAHPCCSTVSVPCSVFFCA